MITAAWARSRSEPFTVGPHDEFELGVLAPGQVVYRWTRNNARSGPSMPMPCHPAQYVTAPDPKIQYRAHCRLCGRAYELELFDENDGGWLAMFTCIDIEILLSHASRKRDTGL